MTPTATPPGEKPATPDVAEQFAAQTKRAAGIEAAKAAFRAEQAAHERREAREARAHARRMAALDREIPA